MLCFCHWLDCWAAWTRMCWRAASPQSFKSFKKSCTGKKELKRKPKIRAWNCCFRSHRDPFSLRSYLWEQPGHFREGVREITSDGFPGTHLHLGALVNQSCMWITVLNAHIANPQILWIPFVNPSIRLYSQCVVTFVWEKIPFLFALKGWTQSFLGKAQRNLIVPSLKSWVCGLWIFFSSWGFTQGSFTAPLIVLS